MVIDFSQIDFDSISLKSVLHSIFNDDNIEVSTVSIERTNNIEEPVKTTTNGYQSKINESHITYPKEEEVTYMVPVPNNGKPRDSSLIPITIMVIDTIGLKKSKVLLKVLIDPGMGSYCRATVELEMPLTLTVMGKLNLGEKLLLASIGKVGYH